MKYFIGLILLSAFAWPSFAQVKPNAQISDLVAQTTKTFFGHLKQQNFEGQRSMFSDQLEGMITSDEWISWRKRAAAQAETIIAYNAHRLTYYERDHLQAAVDFVAKSASPETFICGYLLWDISTPTEIALSRMEQNVVKVPLFRSMPVQDAAQLLANWRCPTNMIEAILGVTIQTQ